MTPRSVLTVMVVLAVIAGCIAIILTPEFPFVGKTPDFVSQRN